MTTDASISLICSSAPLTNRPMHSQGIFNATVSSQAARLKPHEVNIVAEIGVRKLREKYPQRGENSLRKVMRRSLNFWQPLSSQRRGLGPMRMMSLNSLRPFTMKP